MNESTNDSLVSDSAAKPRPGVFSIVSAIIWMIVNSMFGYVMAIGTTSAVDAYASAYVCAYMFAVVVGWQAIAIGLFQIGTRFRNWKSRVRIYNWTSLIVLLGMFAQLGALRLDEPAQRDTPQVKSE